MFQAPFTTYCIDPAAWDPFNPIALTICSSDIFLARPIIAEPEKVAHVPVGWKPISCDECGPNAIANLHAISYPITTEVINSLPVRLFSSPAARAQFTTLPPA